jgi:replicative DNA helicase
MANGRGPDACFDRVREGSIEKAQLGQMLLEREIPRALRFLEPVDLRDALNRAIYAAICAVQAQGGGVDLALVLDQMHRDKTRNDLEFAGGLFYLYECMDLYSALGGGRLYAQRVAELARKSGDE